MKKLYVITIIFAIPHIYALDRLSVTNNTPYEVYGAFYYSIGGSVMKRASQIYAIRSHKERIIPVSKELPDIFSRFAIAAHENDLTGYVYPARVPSLSSRYFDSRFDTSYVITKKNSLFFIYNQDEWRQIKAILGITSPSPYGLLANKIKRDFEAFKTNPYKFSVAHVRQGNTLPAGEQKAVTKRLEKVKEAIEKKFKKPINYVPKISLISSGGGYRSMIMTIGFLAAAEEIGLKDMLTWWATCSGSGWGAAAYYAIKFDYKKSFGQEYSMQEFRKDFFNEIANKGLNPPVFETAGGQIRLMRNALAVNWAAGQAITFVDVYGTLLANRVLAFFGDDRHRKYLSHIAPMIEEGDLIPLWSVVDEATESLWYEFSPWEFGSTFDTCYVPIWSLGRKFNGGSSEDFNPEKSFDFIMGSSGSAFAARYVDVYNEMLYHGSGTGIRGKILRMMSEGERGLKRVSYAAVFNYTFGLPQFKNNKLLELEKEHLTEMPVRRFVDAGLAGNLPYPLVDGERAERMSDILIFLDNAHTVQYKPEEPRIHGLKYAEEYAQYHGLKFPKISYNKLGREPISIFKDVSDVEAPVVIYIPRINYSGFWKELQNPAHRHLMKYIKNFDFENSVLNEKGVAYTFNFNYSFDQAMQTSYIAEFNLKMVQGKIFKEIEDVIRKKSKGNHVQ